MVNSKTTAVRVIPAIGHKAGDVLDFGGLLGHAPIMPISRYSPAVMIAPRRPHSRPDAGAEELSAFLGKRCTFLIRKVPKRILNK